MTPKKTTPRRRAAVRRPAETVDAFLSALDPPARREIESIRRIILAAAPGIEEGIKWNAPSFRFGEYFATVNRRGEQGVRVIFHLGAKVKDNSTAGLRIDDPRGLLRWLSKERAIATFGDAKDIAAKRGALESIVRAWIEYL